MKKSKTEESYTFSKKDRFVPLRTDNHRKLAEVKGLGKHLKCPETPSAAQLAACCDKRETFKQYCAMVPEDLHRLRYANLPQPALLETGTGERRRAARLLAEQNKLAEKAPLKVLDAPAVVRDPSLQLLDWSPSDEVMVALDTAVYGWHAGSGSVRTLFKSKDARVVVSACTFLRSRGGAPFYAVGQSNGSLALYDAHKRTRLRTVLDQTARINALAFQSADKLLVAGAQDGSVVWHDVRQKHSAVHKNCSTHKAAVFSADVAFLTATGDADGVVVVTDLRAPTDVLVLDHHVSPVLALRWAPSSGSLLLSGSGGARPQLLSTNTKDTLSGQVRRMRGAVAGLVFAPNHKEVLVAEGNKLVLCDFPSLRVLSESAAAHSDQVLAVKSSEKDPTLLASLGADERIKLWQVFEEKHVLHSDKMNTDRRFDSGERFL